MPPPAAYDDFTRGIRCFRPWGCMARAAAYGDDALWHTSHQSSLLRNVETHICVSHRRLGKKTCTRMRRAMACLYIPRTMQSSRHDVETRLIASLLPGTSSSLAFALAFRYICFTKIGCGSAKPRREQAPPLVFALAFLYLCRVRGVPACA